MTPPAAPDRDQLLELLSALPDIVLLIDRSREIRFINRAEEGYAREDVIGELAVDFVEPWFRDSFRELLDGVFESARSAEYEIPITDADGDEQWHEGTLTPVVREGRVVGVVVATRNVTERHRAQEEAKKLRSLVPICSWCGRIRNDSGYWEEVEAFIEKSSRSRVTHGMCPECERSMSEGNGAENSA